MKHHDICMHLHTRFRIRKLPKNVCDIYSWCFFYMSDAYVFSHEAMSGVGRLVPFFQSLCLLGLRLWDPLPTLGATAYALATAYTLVTAHVGIRIMRSEVTATVAEGINAALDTEAFALRMAMAAQAMTLETQKALLSAQYAPASGQGNPSPQSGEDH